MRTVEVLHDLQGLDTTVAAERRRLSEILGVLRDRSAVDEAARHAHETDQALHLLQTDLRDRELAAESLRANVREIEAKLYGGKVTSPKELGSLSAEAEQFRKLISGREDTLIELYDRVEAAQQAHAAAQARLKDVETERALQEKTLRSEGRALDAHIKAQDVQRAELRGQVDQRTLAHYDRLIETRGTAVSELRQRTCSACRITIPLDYEARAKADAELVHCPNCSRILWARA